MKIIGDKEKLAIIVGKYWENSKQHQHIDIWLGGKRITAIDNVTYLPAFRTKMLQEYRRIQKETYENKLMNGLLEDEIFHALDSIEDDKHSILCYDSTITSATCFLIEQEGKCRVIFSFWDPRYKPESDIGKVFCVEIDKAEIVNILSKSLENISNVWV